MRYIKNSITAFAVVLITLIFPTSMQAQKDVKVVNSPSEPVPVTGTINVGNTIQIRSVIPAGAFSVVVGNNSPVSGPDPAGTSYAITSITFANGSSSENAFAGVNSNWGNTSDCFSFTGDPPNFSVGPEVNVPAGQTLHLSFPQSFVLQAKPGVASCLRAHTSGLAVLSITVVGFRF